MPIAHPTPVSSVYGPVKSWRVGASLGIDLLLETSTCSFNCVYCQLGNIQLKTAERRIYVSTAQVEKDFKHSAWVEADIVTFSGSGEPTLALNLAEVIHLIKEYSGKPVMVLTNGTLLHDPAVRADLYQADVVAVKLDAATEDFSANESSRCGESRWPGWWLVRKPFAKATVQSKENPR
ncbi:MAG: radical SAM protein [Vampirovibrionales bacterium]